MRLVFKSHEEVAHIWANQGQQRGSASRMFFEGRVIYSYGYHYAIAAIHPTDPNIVFLNKSGYSNSTAKHTNYVRSAIRGRQIINCYEPNGSVRENLRQWGTAICTAVNYTKKKGIRTTTKTAKVAEAASLLEEAKIYFLAIGEKENQFKKQLVETAEKPENKSILSAFFATSKSQSFQEALSDVMAKQIAKEAAEQKRIDKYVNKAYPALSKMVISVFHRTGQLLKYEAIEKVILDSGIPGKELRAVRAQMEKRFTDEFGDLLYYDKTNDEVRTQRQARVSIEDAKLLFTVWSRNTPIHGQRVGMFTVTAANEKEIKIGCHTFKAQEVQHFAKRMQWA